MASSKARDWRADYIICDHVTADSADTHRGGISSFRVCCSECERLGFLEAPSLEHVDRDGLTIGRLIQKGHQFHATR